MTKVVAPGTSLQMNGVSKAKRKTPAELRGEQLKRTCFVDQVKESFDALRPCQSTEKGNGLKNPKYIEMRMNELYAVKKARPWMPSGKENSKENGVKEQSSNLFNVSLLSNVVAIKRQQHTREDKNASTGVSDDTNTKARQANEGCSQCIFRSVTELSTRGEELSCLPDIDMTKALKGLATSVQLPIYPGDISEKSDTASLRGNFVPEFLVSGREIPLDLSIKTYIDCKEMVTAESTSCYIVETKGECIPPWIISNICAHVIANGQNFEASFVTEPTSVSLNMGLPQLPDKVQPESPITEGTGETNDAVSDIPGTVISPQLRSGHLKNLKYYNNSYTVSLSPS
ncbi:hypothetical protein F2Q68_00026353 [Brassica cretica]|uniref:Uncharacterized protein n=1 Tax=Brassica cretica TaxID=69181 RepID=A0A8S9I7I3_BRACR|nr:hypothetical protein F2Q68_00026353 [Brassica cretica]